MSERSQEHKRHALYAMEVSAQAHPWKLVMFHLKELARKMKTRTAQSAQQKTSPSEAKAPGAGRALRDSLMEAP